jgi:hypothetical protein
MSGYPWSAADQLNAADLNALPNIRMLKKNSGGPTSSSSVDLDTVSITGLNANDILLVHYSFAASAGIGSLSLVDNTASVSLIADLLNSSTSSNYSMGTAIIRPSPDSGTIFLTQCHWNESATTETTNRDRFKASTGHTGGFTGTWTLALNKGTDGGSSATYWRWYVAKLFN